MKLKITSLAIAGALFGAAAVPAQAGDAMQDLLKVLRDKGTISSQDYELLISASKADDEKIEDARIRVAKVEDQSSVLKNLSWAEKVQIKGDMRFRWENEMEDDQNVNDRLRMRARLGAYADVNDTTKVGIRLATSTGSATSTNQSFETDWKHQAVGIDLGYIDWAPAALGGNTNFIFGKMKKPWQKVNDMVWDGDTNPEGVAYKGKYKMDGFTLMPSVGYFTLNDNGNDSFFDDVYLMEAQLAAKIGKDSLVGLSYYGYENSTGAVSAEERMYELFGETKIPGTPVTVYASYVNNTNADAVGDDDNAYSLGAKTKYGSWKFGYEYRDTGVNAVNGNFDNSDFANDSKGHILKVAYKLDDNFDLKGTYFDVESNDNSYDDLQLFQLDLVTKF